MSTEPTPTPTPDPTPEPTPAPAMIAKAYHEAEMERQGSRIQGLQAKLNALEAKLSEKPKPKDEPVDLKAYEAQWQKDHVEPVTAKLTAIQQRLSQEAIRAAGLAAGVDERFLKRIAPGKPSFLETMVEIEHDDEHGILALQGGKRIAGQDGRLYADPGDYLQRLKNDKDFAWLYASERNGSGSGYKGSTKESSSKGTKTQAAFDAMSAKAKMDFMLEGGRVEG